MLVLTLHDLPPFCQLTRILTHWKANMMANLIPCERARPTDQANSKTCVMHAIGNAIVEALMDFGLDMKLDEVLGGMKQLPFVDIEGNRVEDFNRSRVKMLTDKNSRDPDKTPRSTSANGLKRRCKRDSKTRRSRQLLSTGRIHSDSHTVCTSTD